MALRRPRVSSCLTASLFALTMAVYSSHSLFEVRSRILLNLPTRCARVLPGSRRKTSFAPFEMASASSHTFSRLLGPHSSDSCSTSGAFLTLKYWFAVRACRTAFTLGSNSGGKRCRKEFLDDIFASRALRVSKATLMKWLSLK